MGDRNADLKTIESLSCRVQILEGEVRRLLAEVSRHAAVQEALCRKEETYRRLVDNAPIGILSADRLGTVLEVNERLLEILGSPCPEATKSINILTFPPLVESGLSHAFVSCIDEDRVKNVEVPYTSKWGKSLYLRALLTPIRDHEGYSYGCQAVIEDITERKRAESGLREAYDDLEKRVEERTAELRQTNARLQQEVLDRKRVEDALRSSEEKYSTIIKSIEDGYYELDLSGGLTFFNDRYSEILGYSRDRLMGMNYRAYLDEANAIKAHEAFNTVYKTGKPIRLFEYEVTKSNGLKSNLEISISLTNSLSDRSVFYGICRDVTDRKQVEVELREAKDAAELANRTKSQFLANMSHELRTPLNAVIGFSEILQDRLFGDLNERQLKYVGHVVNGGRHLLRLINDILDLAKIESGKMELQRTQVNLPQLIEQSMVMIRETAHRHGIKLHLVLPTDARDLQIPADEVKLKQILFNLLSNALKFTPDGGAIQVRARWDETGAVVSISDTGIGLSPKDRERVFEAFEQVDSSVARQHLGTGLGLALTRMLVELHQGRIWVESEGEGKGSTFTFAIPLVGPPTQ